MKPELENKIKSTAIKGIVGLAALASVCLSGCDTKNLGNAKYHLSVYSNDGKLVLSKNIIHYSNIVGNKVDCLTEDNTELKVNGTYLIEELK